MSNSAQRLFLASVLSAALAWPAAAGSLENCAEGYAAPPATPAPAVDAGQRAPQVASQKGTLANCGEGMPSS